MLIYWGFFSYFMTFISIQVQGPLNVMWFWTSWKSIFLARIMVCNGLKMKIKLRLLLPGPFFQKWIWYMTWKLSLKMGKISDGTTKCQVDSWKIILLCEMLNGWGYHYWDPEHFLFSCKVELNIKKVRFGQNLVFQNFRDH